MMLPLTSTLDGAESEAALAIEDAHILEQRRAGIGWRIALRTGGGCQSEAMSESAATTIRLDTEFMEAPRVRGLRYRVLSTDTWFRGATSMARRFVRESAMRGLCR